MNIPVYNTKGQAQATWKLEDKIFAPGHTALLTQALRVYTSNSHQKTSKVKTRGEVVGSTRKIYRQKGTGNARHGAKYAPIFVGGGIAHGPKGVRPVNLSLPKAMRKRALSAAMHLKLSSKAVSGLSGLKGFNGKTSSAISLLSSIASHPKNSVLVITDSAITSLYRSILNLQGVSMKRASLVNALDLVSANHLILTKKALDTLSKRAI